MHLIDLKKSGPKTIQMAQNILREIVRDQSLKEEMTVNFGSRLYRKLQLNASRNNGLPRLRNRNAKGASN